MSMIATMSSGNYFTVAGFYNKKNIVRFANGTLLWIRAVAAGTVPDMWFSTDGGTTWTSGGSSGLSNTSSGDISMAVDDQDRLHIVSISNNSVVVYALGTPTNAQRTAFTWTKFTGIDTNGSVYYDTSDKTSTGAINGGKPDLVVHKEGTGYKVHIAVEYPGSGTWYIRYGRLNVDASNVITRDITTLQDVYSNANTFGPDSSIVMDSSKNIFITYARQNAPLGTWCIKGAYSAGSWTFGSPEQISTTGVTHSADIDSQGRVVIVLKDNSNVLSVFRRNTDGTWVNLNFPAFSGAGSNMNITCKIDDIYVLSSNTTARYKFYNASTGTWSAEVNSAFTDGNNVLVRKQAGQFTSALDIITASGAGPSYNINFSTIALNAAPTAPTNLTRANFDTTQAVTLTWTFNDPNTGDTQSAYQLEIYDTTSPTTPVVSVPKTGSTVSSYSLAANTLTNGKTYQWRVMTYDAAGATSPWSSYATFKCSAPPTSSVTDPVASATITTSSYTFKGSYSQANGVVQQSFQFKLWDSTGATVLQDSGTIIGLTNQYTFSNLANNTSYKIEFITTSQDGIIGSSGKVAFTVAYTPPAIPTGVTTTNDAPNARITVAFTNPAGTPTAASNNAYRRKQGDAIWKLRQQSVTSPYYDYLCPSGNYEYSVTALTSNGAESANSATAQVTSSFNGEWVIDERNSSNNVRFYYNFTNPHIKTNQQRAVVETFAIFPFIRKGLTHYHSGVLQAIYIKQDGDLLTQLNAIDAMTMTDNTYILKFMNGLIYRVSLSAPSDINTHSGSSLGELTLEWTEVGYV